MAVVRVAGVVAAVILCVLGRSSLGRALPDTRRLLPTLVHVPRVVMGFTVWVLVGLGVFWWVGGGVWVVFAGFLGGVGVDLVWGWGACRVIRVAAADAER